MSILKILHPFCDVFVIGKYSSRQGTLRVRDRIEPVARLDSLTQSRILSICKSLFIPDPPAHEVEFPLELASELTRSLCAYDCGQ